MSGKRICRVKLQMVDALSGAAVQWCNDEVGGGMKNGEAMDRWSVATVARVTYIYQTRQ